MLVIIAALILVFAAPPDLVAQTIRTFRLGGSTQNWQDGGDGKDPLILSGSIFSPKLDTTNVPGGAIDFVNSPGWIGPLRFDQETNIASRVLEEGGSIRAPNAVEDQKLAREQLRGTVNGDHRIAFERKPTATQPRNPLGIWIILDFFNPIGIQRVRFYPRNTVDSIPGTTYHNDFLRAFELWVNPALTNSQRSPDILASRETANDMAVVDIELRPQYTRLIKLKSLSDIPWEIDEVEVYATGYLQEANYISDLIDLGDRATLGQVTWRENIIGKAFRSAISVQARTGDDNTPFVFNKRILDEIQVWHGDTEVVEGAEYVKLNRREKDKVEDDLVNWSPWKSLENGQLISAPGQRQFIQFKIDFAGDLFDARELNWLSFNYLQPPLADTLRAEVFPRLVAPEERATFRYALFMRATGPVRGFDRLEVDSNAPVENIRNLTLNNTPLDFEVRSIGRDGFELRFPLVAADSSLVEFTFDMPIFRFGTTFSARAYNTRAGNVPQRLEPGNALNFGPDDVDELSSLSVAIPRSQVGKLVGEIVVSSQIFTPNDDGVNDTFQLFFNLLQLTRSTPVALEIYALTGQHLHTIAAEERTIGPVTYLWNGRLDNDKLLAPGHYIWLLRIKADAFEERHLGALALTY